MKSPAYDFTAAIDAATKGRAQALFVVATPISFVQRKRIASLALGHRMPTITASRDSVDDGALISYGANVAEMFGAAGVYVDKILRGAKPADLPMEQPTKYELVVNLKTAKALGLALPSSLLQRADHIVQ